MVTFRDAAATYLPEAIRTVEAELDVRLGPIRVVSVREDLDRILAGTYRTYLAKGNERLSRKNRNIMNLKYRLTTYVLQRWKNRLRNVVATAQISHTRTLLITDEIGDQRASLSVKDYESTIYHELYHVGFYRYAMSKGLDFSTIEEFPEDLNEGFAEAATTIHMLQRDGSYTPNCSAQYVDYAGQLFIRIAQEHCTDLRQVADLVLRLANERTTNY